MAINFFSKVKKQFNNVSLALDNFIDINFIFSNILFPLIILAFYFLSFEFILSRVFEIWNGVTYLFIIRSRNIFSLLALGCTLIFIIYLKLIKNEKNLFPKSTEKISTSDFYLLLFPLSFVIQYILNNQAYLSIWISVYIFIIFVLFSAFYVLAAPALFHFSGSTRTLKILGLAFVFIIIYMPLLSQNWSWFERGSLRIQWTVFFGFFLFIWILYSLIDRKTFHWILIFFFVSNCVIQVIELADRNNVPYVIDVDNSLISLVKDKNPIITPNIYLLVYDSYVSNETLLGYGIDNSDQEKLLEDLSFKIYPQTYSISEITLRSMSRVLNASTEFYGSERRAVSGDGVIQNVLRNYGYQSFGLFSSDYFFREFAPTYYYSTPQLNQTPNLLLEAILSGEFRFDIGFDNQPQERFIETKQNILKGASENQVFIYMHSYFPGHSQNSGTCLPNETEIFSERLKSANIEMQEDVNIIIENDPNAIIIVAGDHGPYLTKNCTGLEGNYNISEVSRLDIQDRFGAFLAIRWPSGDYEKFDDITVLQDIFPSVFAYIFNDVRILESKIDATTISSFIKVEDGIILMGINEGEPLFITED